jgi:hypothetical protein
MSVAATSMAHLVKLRDENGDTLLFWIDSPARMAIRSSFPISEQRITTPTCRFPLSLPTIGSGLAPGNPWYRLIHGG